MIFFLVYILVILVLVTVPATVHRSTCTQRAVADFRRVQVIERRRRSIRRTIPKPWEV